MVVTELITLLLEARDERQRIKSKAQLAKQHLLILDELGYVPASKVGTELLFDIIGTAYERQSLSAYPTTQKTPPLAPPRRTGEGDLG